MGIPIFCLPKKDNTIRIVHNFRRVNAQTRCKPYPLPYITDTVQHIGKFKYATCLDLNMGYYAMGLDEDSKKNMHDSYIMGKLQV